MKILLVSTGKNHNPGDQFIRLGIQKLVTSVCSEAVFERVDKETPEDTNRERPYDKVILCGMPLWWDNPVSFSASIHWWNPLIRGWLSERKKDFLILGAGSVVGRPPFNAVRFAAAVEECVERAHAVVVRNPVMDHPKLISSICPAVFTAYDPSVLPVEKTLRVCNLMPSGAHDAHLDEEEAALWRERVLPGLAKRLRELGFVFCAHDQVEYDMARSMGWESPLFFETPEEYVRLYQKTQSYIGNRLHAGVVVAAAGGCGAVVGYDSRIEMVRPLSPLVFKPSQLLEKESVDNLITACTNGLHGGADPALLERHRQLQRNVLRQFLFQ
jgi:hypothetical protein